MKKILIFGLMILVAVAFTGVASAASTTYKYSSWESDYHPSIGKIMYGDSSTSTYKTSTYSSTTVTTTTGKVVSYTKTTIKVKCTEKTVMKYTSKYTGTHTSTSYYTYYHTIYRD
jgi:hypothetical protein